MPKTNHERLLIRIARRAPELVPAAGWLLAWAAPGAQLDLRAAWPSPDELKALADVGGVAVADLMRDVRIEGDLKTLRKGVGVRQLAAGAELARARKAPTLGELVSLLRPVDLLTARATAAARTGVGVESVLESSPAVPLPAVIQIERWEFLGSGVGVAGPRGLCGAIVVLRPATAAFLPAAISGARVGLTCLVFGEGGGFRRHLEVRVQSVERKANGALDVYLREEPAQ